MELESKVAIVTGGAIRIGRAISVALAREGCNVLIHYGRSFQAAEETQAVISASGGNATLYQADLSDASALPGIVSAAISTYGRVDILVNNGAIFLSGDIGETTLDMWDRQFAINLKAPFFLCQAFAEQVPPDRRGAIINITDARIFRPEGDHIAYRLTKTALHALTEILARDLAPQITVNELALGAILPPPGKDRDHLLDFAKEMVPLQIPGDAEAVADGVIHLLRQEFITGATLKMDGGQFI